MMDGNLRQSYLVSPEIDPQKLSQAPIPLVPIETDGTYLFEQIRAKLSERCGIISEDAFDQCDLLLDHVAEKHSKAADAFVRKRHPLLIFVLGYQDGLTHALQRIGRMRRTGEYHSEESVHNRMHAYELRAHELVGKKDFWNASYARGYHNGMMFLLLANRDPNATQPPFFDAPFDVEIGSLAAVLRVKEKAIPRSVMAQAKRTLRRLPKEAKLVPDHTPFL